MGKAEKIRVYARCKWRGQHMLGLSGEDLKKFISECMSEEIDANRQRPLTKDERLQRALKLVVKYKRREQKPQKPKEHRFVYVNVTPRSESVLQDFFINPEDVNPSKKEFDSWMDERGGSASYQEIMGKLKEIEN